MATTVIGLIDSKTEAQKAVDELLQGGFEKKDIGLISSELVKEAADATAGASTGMLVGGLAGMLLAATALLVPGIGPVLVAGPALTLFAGTTLGMLAGGLIGGLTAKGIPEADAHFYAEGVRRGATLITVYAKTDELAQRALGILKKHGAMDIEQRAQEWKQRGWNGKFEEKPQTAASPVANQDRIEPLAAVSAYSLAIEMEAPPGASVPSYGGPNRRTGQERRNAAT